METALHEVVHNTEKSFMENTYTLENFVDIEGTLNNMNTGTLVQSLDQFNVDRVLIDWIQD